MATRWNFGTPKMGQQVVSYRDVRAERAGKTYTASYHVDDDGSLVLSSAWGSIRAGVTRKTTLKEQAERLLETMLDERVKHG